MKALAALQVGAAYSIGVNGVWMAAKRDSESGATALHPAILENFSLLGRTVYLAFDADFGSNPQVRQALIRTAVLLHKAGAEVKILTWPLDQGKGSDDFLVKAQNREAALQVLYDDSSDLSGVLRPCDLDFVRIEMIKANLAESKISQIARMVSTALDTRASALENDCRPVPTAGSNTMAPKDPEPWPEPVNGAALLDEIKSVIRDHVVLKDSEASTVAVWVLMNHCEPYVDVMPFRGLPRRCGNAEKPP